MVRNPARRERAVAPAYQPRSFRARRADHPVGELKDLPVHALDAVWWNGAPQPFSGASKNAARSP
jgi:hypothetical protein